MKSCYIKPYFSLPICLFFVFIITCSLSKVNGQVAQQKKGGVLFRVDDNKPIANYIEYANIFKKYGFNFLLSIPPGEISSDYAAQIKTISDEGNEVADHAPNHTTRYFVVKPEEREYYRNLKGVDHINKNKVCLAWDSLSFKSYKENGLATIIQYKVYSTSPGAFKELRGMTYGYIYFPSIKVLCYVKSKIASVSTDIDTLDVVDYWGDAMAMEPKKNIEFQIIGVNDIFLSSESLALLADRSKRLFNQFNIPQPTTFIQPGGEEPLYWRKDVQNANRYSSASIAPDVSLKCYNEFDPNHNKRFGMLWGDFFEDFQLLNQCKRFISNEIAKHRIAIGHNHFVSLNGGWSGFVPRMDSLLAWCKDKGIYVKTQKEWASLLYDSVPDPYVNIIPSLSTDLDEDGTPDGYTLIHGKLDTTNIPINDNFACITSKIGDNTYDIKGLGGLEKGENIFSVWADGNIGNSMTITLKFPESGYTQYLSVKVDSTNWHKKTWIVTVPDSISLMNVNVTCNQSKFGIIRLSRMEFRKRSSLDIKYIPTQVPLSNGTYNPLDLQESIIDPLYKNNELNYSVNNSKYLYGTVSSNGILRINKKDSTWFGEDSICLTISNPDGVTINKYVKFESHILLKMPSIFSNNMVIQQNSNMPVWGVAKPNDKIFIRTSWLGQELSTTADSTGNWKTFIPTPKAVPGTIEPLDMMVSGPLNTIHFEEMLAGEVWLCSGGSNMVYPMDSIDNDMRGVINYESEISNANDPNIRLFDVMEIPNEMNKGEQSAIWKKCTLSNVSRFSAIAYYFGRELYNNRSVGVPIGLINGSFKDTYIESWVDSNIHKRKPNDPKPSINEDAKSDECTFFTTMLTKIKPFSIKGLIWYPSEYPLEGTPNKTIDKELLSTLREKWGNHFSYYSVLLTPYLDSLSSVEDVEYNRAIIREEQMKILSEPKTGVVVTSDIYNDKNELHRLYPQNKYEVGTRLAKWALSNDYNQNIDCLGPMYESFEIEDRKIRINFNANTVGKGFGTIDNDFVKCFRIASDDNIFYTADAVIQGNSILVSSPYVIDPYSVRYAFSDGAITNLINMEGLSAYPFRTDTIRDVMYADAPFVDSVVASVSNDQCMVYPSPFREYLYVRGKNSITNVEMFDLFGKKVSVIIKINNIFATIKTDGLKKGIYFIKVFQNNMKESVLRAIKL